MHRWGEKWLDKHTDFTGVGEPLRQWLEKNGLNGDIFKSLRNIDSIQLPWHTGSISWYAFLFVLVVTGLWLFIMMKGEKK